MTLHLRDREIATLCSIFRRFPSVQEVRLFGLRATGHSRRASDIDLAISAPDASADQWLELIDAINEAPIIYDIVVVRTERAHSPRLLQKIASEGMTIYQKEMVK